ncbi:glycosyltransferase [Salinarimonas chemoclinalis]|uniref:glycosyltransferase n=1 Tax=Salinarimonas chemoclinalis TaxID=3241599 RepID=UPI003558C6EC
MTVIAILALAFAALGALLAAVNLGAMRTPAFREAGEGTRVSVLIPARDEEENIAACVESALASEGVAVEVVVMDDGSTDRTAEIVAALAARDARVRLERAPPLPAGWTGKVHACQRLADAARGTHLLFVDADVRLAQRAAASLVAHQETKGLGLVSAVPRQVTKTWGEGLTVPMINFLMLGYLPVPMMRTRPDRGLGAACGQMMLFPREAYDAIGGHASIRHLLHDGIQLARRLRDHGRMTDVVLGSELAVCRMYDGFGPAWAGFIKNAHEGMASWRQLPVWTALLGFGHVLPPILVALALVGIGPLVPALGALVLSLGMRAAITRATGESWWTVPLHPATVGVGLAIQWASLLKLGRGRAGGWKGRVYPAQ